MVLDEPRENDEIFDEGGLVYVIEKSLLEMTKPLKVDYVSSLFGSGFKIDSGMNVGAVCGESCSC